MNQDTNVQKEGAGAMEPGYEVPFVESDDPQDNQELGH